jgi:hypothetical protein
MNEDQEYQTVPEAVAETGLPDSTVRWFVRAKGLGAQINGRPMVDTAALRAKLEFRRSTLSATEAARKYGVTSNTIGNWCVAYDIATKVGCRWRVDEAKLDALVATRGIRAQEPSRRRRLPAASDQGSVGE